MASEQRGWIETASASASAQRVRAAAPRAVFLVAIAALALAGARHVFLPPAPVIVQRTLRVGSERDGAHTDAFAEVFARTYLSFDGGDSSAHEHEVASFLRPGTELAGTVAPSMMHPERVIWTAVAGHSGAEPGTTVVTVALALDIDPVVRYLAVPVAESSAGALAVTAAPAFVAAPARDSREVAAPTDDVGDAELRVVVTRALASYLRSSGGALDADLLPGVRVPLPPEALVLQQASSLSWAGAGRVAAVVSARAPSGTTYVLRYLLAVEHRDRWYVAGFNPPDPIGGQA